MIQGRCPICSKPFQVATIGDLPSFPFCSDRCRLIDLGRWSDGAYAIPASPARGESEDDETSTDSRATEEDFD
jgi:endogenous inhibitor of DNA gyrase (YacG/DUF329 family)